MSWQAPSMPRRQPGVTGGMESRPAGQGFRADRGAVHQRAQRSTRLLQPFRPTTTRRPAHYYHDAVISAMDEVRAPADKLEGLVGKKFWPFPTYSRHSVLRLIEQTSITFVRKLFLYTMACISTVPSGRWRYTPFLFPRGLLKMDIMELATSMDVGWTLVAAALGILHAGRLCDGGNRLYPGKERRQHHHEKPDGLLHRHARSSGSSASASCSARQARSSAALISSLTERLSVRATTGRL